MTLVLLLDMSMVVNKGFPTFGGKCLETRHDARTTDVSISNNCSVNNNNYRIATVDSGDGLIIEKDRNITAGCHFPRHNKDELQ
jgi:hypothetical protein